MSITVIEGGVCAPEGFSAAGLHCGIAKSGEKKDLALIYSKAPCAGAAVYTQNKVKASPVLVTKRHLEDGKLQAIICNSGNANACNADGEAAAIRMCEAAAKELGLDPRDVAVASTGVIGQPLPVEKIEAAAPALAKALSEDKAGSWDCVQAIMTTDTAEKEIAVSFEIGGKTCRLGGVAKGSGMIEPNMGTMLSFLTTDASITPAMLQEALALAVKDSFNMISVDGDTSTNDMAVLLANGLAGNATISEKGHGFSTFLKALRQVCVHLARQMAKDGEGATKLLECSVSGAPDEECARVLAKSVINSSLLKAAMFGADANWGRVLCALGYAKAEFDITKTQVSFASRKGEILVCQDGAGVPFSEEQAKEILLEDEIQILVGLHQGSGNATAWGCDLTYDYVKINGDYRS